MRDFDLRTVDGRKKCQNANHRLDGAKTLQMGENYQPQLVNSISKLQSPKKKHWCRIWNIKDRTFFIHTEEKWVDRWHNVV